MKHLYRILAIAALTLFPCTGILLPADAPQVLPVLLLAVFFVFVNLFPGVWDAKPEEKRWRQCLKGAQLLRFFLYASYLCMACWVVTLVRHLSGADDRHWSRWLVAALLILLSQTVVYLGGILRVFRNSAQVGFSGKALLFLGGWVPVWNLFLIPGAVRKAEREALTEDEKHRTDLQRREQQICKTRYPLLMVHGIFFRDFKPAFLNYWGRISQELTENGAQIYYGNQQSAASVESCGRELADRIRQIVAETGCEKVNIIAHSKGGLDSRAAIARYGAEDLVASLTTVNTPHRGCEFADYLLGEIEQNIQDKVAGTYNAALRKLGDPAPDFLEGVTDLTHSACAAFNERTPDSPKIYYQSVGSVMPRAAGGRFPLNFSYHLVKHFDGENDGLVGEGSFPWGEHFEMLRPEGSRGISHGDMIDLNRENIEGFDVREFYVQLVNGLRQKGF
ncbi:MAG: alpha/beta fold hydrolase [Lachnospiraceae bacterium]|nr:alpha/beta fold hydrolase [Lachnospiraceae bacterium]